MPIWCDLSCPHADWPKDDALDGSRSCRTFVAIQCSKYDRLMEKNAPCLDLRRSKEKPDSE